MTNYDTWKARESDEFFAKNFKEVPCKSCGATGREQVGTTTQGEPVIDNCHVCGGEGCL